MSFRRPETQKYQPRFFLLKRLNYSTPSTSSGQVISSLTRFCILCCIYPLIVGAFILLIHLVLTKLHITTENNFTWTVVTTIFFLIGLIPISYDVIHEFVFAEIEVIEEKYSALSVENIRLMELEKSSDNNLRKEQQDFYYARLKKADENILNNIKLIDLASRTSSDNNMEEALSYYDKKYTEDQSRIKLRAVITTIKEDSWIQLATSAALKALDLNPDIPGDLNKLKTEQNLSLFKDIYIYLYAWLVSSIDNNIATAIPFMDVQPIGLHYPEIEKYQEAFYFLRKIFDNDMLFEFIDDIPYLSPEEIIICRKISPYLNELITRLNTFESSRS